MGRVTEFRGREKCVNQNGVANKKCLRSAGLDLEGLVCIVRIKKKIYTFYVFQVQIMTTIHPVGK